MSTVHTSPPRRRRLGALGVALVVAASGVLVTAAPVTAESATPVVVTDSLVWGVRESFRNYLAGDFAHGSTTVDGGTAVLGDGTFEFPMGKNLPKTNGAYDGSVAFLAHDGALDLEFSNLRVVLSGTTGTLVLDAVSRPYAGPTEPPQEPVAFDDVAFATLDLTGITPTANGALSTYSGVPAVLTEAGVPAFGGFYTAGEELDPLTFDVWVPKITLSKSTPISPLGETITVTGSGFAPDVNTAASRPPLYPPGGSPIPIPDPLNQGGVYLVFGKFAAQWAPSTGAGGGTRQVIDQKWPLPEASKTWAETNFGPNAQYVVLNPDGTFTTTLLVKPDATKTNPNYGIVTYSAGGAAANVVQETFTPITFAPSPFSDVGADHLFLDEVNWMAAEGVSTGYLDGTFRPTAQVTRQTAAAFLWNLAGSPEAPEDAPTFSDVPESHQFYEAISWLASEGAVLGYEDGTFRPTDLVSRQSAAAFMWRLEGMPPAGLDAPSFTDVPESHTFHDAIVWMADAGIAQGYEDDTFRPTTPLSRQAISAFLYRAYQTPV